MSEKEIIERLIGIIERLLDENERLRKQYIVSSISTYPKPVTIPTTFPAPTITCDTEAKV